MANINENIDLRELLRNADMKKKSSNDSHSTIGHSESLNKQQKGDEKNTVDQNSKQLSELASLIGSINIKSKQDGSLNPEGEFYKSAQRYKVKD